ncbi:MAG: ADP-glyceromanno-heptose 6-epimerase [Bacteroidota bacterium]|nr:ADP-glyceromanno-heptose 6-epimerase [Bacteroidota bacterium]
MIVITGAAGFIGSCFVSKLNQLGYKDLVLVDNFNNLKKKNLDSKRYKKAIPRDKFLSWFEENSLLITYVFHLGARTDTTELDSTIFKELNLKYSKKLWNICSNNDIPFFYASSAATYGIGEFGFTDNLEIISQLRPLNPYGISKNDFDIWAIKQKEKPSYWIGLKFFNVYGPNEYHKGRMASVIYHSYQQIKKNGEMQLFRSHKDEYKDGEQLRDFIYVKDITEVLAFLLENRIPNSIYNLGSGVERSFNDLVKSVFVSIKKKVQIKYIDIPLDIRESYQYFTKAQMTKLQEAGYNNAFTSLEDGIFDYVTGYLSKNKYY